MLPETDSAHRLDLQAAVDALVTIEPRFAPVARRAAPLSIRMRKAGFATLADIIVSQQLSVGAADAIAGRLLDQGIVSRQDYLDASDDVLRQCGLSHQKIGYIRALALGGVDFDALESLPDRSVVEILTGIRGIGPWTAKIYLIFCLGRLDVIPAGDLAVREAARDLLLLEDRPTERQLLVIAEAWTPWRTVAACLLWECYRMKKKRVGIR